MRTEAKRTAKINITGSLWIENNYYKYMKGGNWHQVPYLFPLSIPQRIGRSLPYTVSDIYSLQLSMAFYGRENLNIDL